MLVTLVFLQLIVIDRNSSYDNALNIAEDTRPEYPEYCSQRRYRRVFLPDIILKSRKLTLSLRAKG